MLTPLINFIKTYGLQALEEQYAIKSKRHLEFPNLVLLKYNQIDSPMNKKIVQLCRGIILDEDNNWRPISFPYTKFFNAGEIYADKIDWNTAQVMEKLDGSLAVLYRYANSWHVATSGVPDASGEVNGTNFTFAELFWKTWKDLDYQLPHSSLQNICYFFELCTKFNRIVVQYPKPKLVLHGARELNDFKELNPVVIAYQNNWECVKIYSLQTLDKITEASKNLEPLEQEGYVIRDSQYRRIKVKSPAYVSIAHLRDGFSTRRLLEIVRTGEKSEFLSYFEEFKDMYWEIRAKYENLAGRIEGFYNAIKHIDDRKQFAHLATTQNFSNILFNLKFGKKESIKDCLAKMNIKNLEQWLDIKSVEL